MSRLIRLATLMAVLVALSAGAALSQSNGSGSGVPSPQTAQEVVAIDIVGLVTVDSGRVVRTFGISVGDVVSAPVVRDGLKKLWQLQVFNDVWITHEEQGSGIAILIHVVERPRISEIIFEGIDKLKEDDLLPILGMAVGQRLSSLKLAAAEDSVLRIYQAKGFVSAGVEVKSAPHSPTESIVTFIVIENEQARITAFEFPGATSFPWDELRGKMEHKTKGFLKSGKVDPEKLEKDGQNLRRFYRDRGFKDVVVSPPEMKFSEDGESLTLIYPVEEGNRYRIGDVSWEGYQSIDEYQLKSLPHPIPGQYYDASEIQKTVEAAYSHYAELGYLYVSVEPIERVVARDTVDLIFRFEERAPSKLRQIHITGNTYTKEKVVRRELAIREGDRFSRTLLMRSQQNVFRLGFFEDVQVDFRPADSTDVDLYFMVKEKRSGTASAGAGFSSGTGLTGFLQLGHNNLFGNGQAINIQLERGARRNAVNLSFTDPWFMDTRTTFGFSIFWRENETSVFTSAETADLLQINETRRGGSLRLGRPLPFMDYTRGFVTYRLENTKQEVIASEAGLTQSELDLQNQLVTPELTTSSITLSLIRDSRNNPFYPSGGSRILYSSEFAGKIFGGTVHFNKHEFDGRFYFPSVVRGLASMVRWRGGVLAGYGDQRFLPDFEKFRLGGTTFYGLRGYRDFEIVPEANITRTFSDGPTGEPIEVEIRYPGGSWFSILTLEQQFPIANPLRGLFFLDIGNTWNGWEDITPLEQFKGAGFGFRLEVPLLGNLGLDIGYGFDRTLLGLPVPGWRTHFLLGNMLF